MSRADSAAAFRVAALAELALLGVGQVVFAPPAADALDGEQVADGAAQHLHLVGGRRGQPQAVPELARPVAVVLEKVAPGLLLFLRGQGGEFQRQVGDEEPRVAVRHVARRGRPDDGGGVAGQTFLDHRLDAGAHAGFVAGDGVGLLLDEEGDVGVFPEAVAHAVEVQVEALLPELLEARLRGRAVEVGADGDAQQGLADARRQQGAVRAAGAAQAAERAEEHRGGEAGRGLPAGLGGHFAGAAGVDAPRARVGADEVVLQAGQEVFALPHFLEEGEADVGVADRHVAGTEQRARPARTVRRPQARGEEAQRAARALELRHGRPPLPHHVDQRGVERVRRGDPVAERQSFLVRLPAFRITLRVRMARPGEHLPPRFRRGARRPRVGRRRQQPPLDDVQYLVALDRLPALVLAGGQMLHGPQQAGVFQRLPLARLQRVDQHRVVHGAHRHRQPLEERQRLVAERGPLDADAAGADEIFQQFVDQDQARTAAEQRDDLVAAGGDARLVLRPHDLVAVAPAERPRHPAPGGPRRERPRRRALAGGGVEELPVEHRHPHAAGTGQPRRLRQDVERRPRPGAVQQRGQGVRLAAAERGQQLQHAVAPRTGQAPEHVVEQRPQAAGQVRRPEEAVRVAVDGRHARQFGGRQAGVSPDQVVGQRAEVEREDVLRELVREDVGVQRHALDPRAEGFAHRSSLASVNSCCPVIHVGSRPGARPHALRPCFRS